jgi:hypothetical protein
MVLSYLASYVYAPSASASSSSSNSSSSNSRGNNVNDGPAPTRANSIRRSTASSRYSSSSRGSTSRNARNGFSSIPEDEDAAAGGQDNGGLDAGAANATARQNRQKVAAPDDPSLAAIWHINNARSLYEVVGISRTFTANDELRRAYMARCRACHPECVNCSSKVDEHKGLIGS